MQAKTLLLPLFALSLGLVACDDPIARKEFAIATEEAYQGTLLTGLHTDFSKWRQNGSYFLPLTNTQSDSDGLYWASASNEGYTLLNSDPTRFPVIPLATPSANDSVSYTGAIIRSIQGIYFLGFGTNLIAGALYTGQVNRQTLSSRPLESTLFGQPYSSGIPLQLEFAYQYQAGPQVIHGRNARVELPAEDRASASAVFYEVTEDNAFLNGTNLQTDPRIVAKGYVELAPTTPEEWTKHTLRLEVIDSARYDAIDFASKQYRLALVFSSSFRGAEYIGAVGSELRLREVTVKDQPKQNN